MNDLRYALRQLRRRPRFAVAAIALLTLGLGATVSVLTVARAYLLRSLPFRQADRLVWILRGPTRDAAAVPDGLADADWSGTTDVFSQTLAWDLDGYTLTGEPGAEYADGAWVSPGFFPTLDIRPALGRALTEADAERDESVAVISHALWQRRFGGDSSIIGRSIELFSTDRPAEAGRVTVVGILPRDFWYFNRFTDVLLPLRGERMPTLARLAPGVTLQQAETRINAVIGPQLHNVPRGWHLSLVTAHDEHVYRARPALVMLLVATGCLLALTCLNVAGLFVARGAERHRELALRAALGATGRHLTYQLMAESLLITLAAGVLGTLLAAEVLPLLAGPLQRQLGVTVPGGLGQLRPDPLALGTALLVILGVGVVLASLPFFHRAGASAAGFLRSGGGTAGSRSLSRTRTLLVAAELAVATTLMVGTGLMARTVGHLQHVDLGFDPAGRTKAELLVPLARFPEPSDRIGLMDRLIDQVNADARMDAAAVFPYPLRPGPTREVTVDGSVLVPVVVYTIAGEYFTVAGIAVSRGRPFGPADVAGAEPVTVISATLAERLFPGGNAVGQMLDLDPDDADSPRARVIGVVDDVREQLTGEPVADLYVPYAQNARQFMALLVRHTAGPFPAASLSRVVERVDPTLALSELESMDAVVAAGMRGPRFLAGILGSIAAIALLVGSLGLYATIGYMVFQRRREFAVRMAVGAGNHDLIRLIFGEGSRITVIGLAAGLATSALAVRILASQLHGVPPTDPWSYAAAILILGVTAALALILPARRVARIDPMEALRHE